MSVALVVVKKDLGGHVWSNTHAVQIGAGTTGVPSDADLTTLGMGVPLTPTNTASSPANLIQRLVFFERLLHHPDVHFNTVYVTDGKNRKESGNPTQYANLACDFNGIINGESVAQGVVLEPGVIAWLILRTAQGYGHRPGRMFIRGGLIEGQVKAGGSKMIDWESTTAQGNQATYLANAITTSTIGTHFYGGTNAGAALLGIPHYLAAWETTDPLRVGDLDHIFPLTGYTSSRPVGRQTQRGRKRKVAFG